MTIRIDSFSHSIKLSDAKSARRCNISRLAFVSAVFLIANLGLTVFAANQNKKPSARVSIGETTRDFGDVYSGEELDQIFPITNTGDAPLELSEKRISQSLTYRGQRFAAIPVALSRPAPT